MADEVRRVADEGLPRGHVLGEPGEARLAELPQRPLGPVLAGVQRRGHGRLPAHRLVVASSTITSVDAPIDVMITLQPMNIVQAAADLAVVAGAARSSPTCSSRCPRAASAGSRTSSSGSTTSTSTTTLWTGQDFGDQLPSEVFREHFITCFIDDPSGVEQPRHDRHRHASRWECDYPHSDSTWPDSPETAAPSRSTACPTTRSTRSPTRTRCGTSSYDPFARIPKEQCTVGALRAQATGVDTSNKSSGKPVHRPDSPVKIIDLAAVSTPK